MIETDKTLYLVMEYASGGKCYTAMPKYLPFISKCTIFLVFIHGTVRSYYTTGLNTNIDCDVPRFDRLQSKKTGIHLWC